MMIIQVVQVKDHIGGILNKIKLGKLTWLLNGITSNQKIEIF